MFEYTDIYDKSMNQNKVNLEAVNEPQYSVVPLQGGNVQTSEEKVSSWCEIFFNLILWKLQFKCI